MYTLINIYVVVSAVLFSWARFFTLEVPLSTQDYWLLNAKKIPALDWHAIQGE